MEKTDDEDSYSEKKNYDVGCYHQPPNEAVYRSEHSECEESGFAHGRVDPPSMYYTSEGYHYSTYPSVYGPASPRPPYLSYNPKSVDNVSHRSLSSSYRHPYPVYDYHDQVYGQPQLSSDVYSVGNSSDYKQNSTEDEQNLNFDARVSCHERLSEKQRGFELQACRENMASGMQGTHQSNANLTHMEKFNQPLASNVTPPPLIKTQTSDLLAGNHHQQTAGLRFPYFQSHVNQDNVAMSGIPSSDPLDLRKTDVVEDVNLSGAVASGAKDEDMSYSERRTENQRLSHFQPSAETHPLELIKNEKPFHIRDAGEDISGRGLIPRNKEGMIEEHTPADRPETQSQVSYPRRMDPAETDLRSRMVVFNARSPDNENKNKTKSVHVEKHSECIMDAMESSHLCNRAPNKELDDGAIFKDSSGLSASTKGDFYKSVSRQSDMCSNMRIEGIDHHPDENSPKIPLKTDEELCQESEWSMSKILVKNDKRMSSSSAKSHEVHGGLSSHCGSLAEKKEAPPAVRSLKDSQEENGKCTDLSAREGVSYYDKDFDSEALHLDQSNSTHQKHSGQKMNGDVSNELNTVNGKDPGIRCSNISNDKGGNDDCCGNVKYGSADDNVGQDADDDNMGGNDKDDNDDDDKGKGGNNKGGNDKYCGNVKHGSADDKDGQDADNDDKDGQDADDDGIGRGNDEGGNDKDGVGKNGNGQAVTVLLGGANDVHGKDDVADGDDDAVGDDKDVSDDDDAVDSDKDVGVDDIVHDKDDGNDGSGNDKNSNDVIEDFVSEKKSEDGDDDDDDDDDDGEDDVKNSQNEKIEINSTRGQETADGGKKDSEKEERKVDGKENEGQGTQNFICGYCEEVFSSNSLLIQHKCSLVNSQPEVLEEIHSDGQASASVLGKRKKTHEEDTSAKKTRSNADAKKSDDDSLDSTKTKVKIENASIHSEPVRRSSRKNKANVKMKEWMEEEEDEDPYICGECGQTFDREKLLLRHMKQHNNSDYEDFSGSEASADQWQPRSQRPKRKAAMRRISYDETSEGFRQSLRSLKRRVKSADSEMFADMYLDYDDDDDDFTKVRCKRPAEEKSSANMTAKSCIVCGEVFQDENRFKDHLLEHCEDLPADQKTLLCAYCDKSFVNQIFLTNHEDVHVDNGDEKLVRAPPVNISVENKYKCTKCEKSFKLKGYLKLHMKTHKVKSYQCSQCEEKFVNKGDYLLHKKTHKVKQEYICELCGKEYSYKSGLSIHMKSHSEKQKQTFDCLTCNRSFYSQGHLAIHIKGHKHAGTKKHRCQECGYQVYDEEKLFRHLESHINQDPFVCPFCGKLFMKKSTFVKHKKKHSGENMCDVCGKAFSHRSGLDRHYTIHSGEKPYKCEQCDKSFSQQSNLTTHQRQHSGEKPFMCEICAQSFTNKCSLVRHMTKHSESETAGLAGISMVNKSWMWP